MCAGTGWSPHPLVLCGGGGCELHKQLCEACLGGGRVVTNRLLLKQRIGRALKAHREKHGESIFQEVQRLGLDIVGPSIIASIEHGKLTATCAYAPRFARRAARVAIRSVDAVDPADGIVEG